MSTDSEQIPLPGMGIPDEEREHEAPEDHLSTDAPNKKAIEADHEKGEYYCEDGCYSRITRNTTNFKEYGHDTDCKYHLFVGSPS